MMVMKRSRQAAAKTGWRMDNFLEIQSGTGRSVGSAVERSLSQTTPVTTTSLFQGLNPSL